MFKALGPRDMDILNSQEIVRLAIYVMKRSSIELADPVLCEKVHTEGEKRRAAAAASAAATGGGGASSIYLTKDFDIGNSLLHHRSKRPSRSLESVLSIATFCARASNPSARRASAGAMTCLAISILREASSSSSSTTDSALSGQGREIGGRVSAKNLPAPTLGARNAGATRVQDSGFESGASGLELLDAQSDDIASDASSSSSSSLSSPTMSSSSLPSSETVTLRHGQSSYATSASREESQRTTNKDYRPRLELKHKTKIRPRTEGSGGSTPRMAASPSPSGGSPYIVFDRSHQNDTVIRHPLQSDTSAQQQAGQGQEQDLYEEESEASESGAWTPSSVLSDSLAEDFAPDVTAGGDWRSNMYASTGTRTPRDEDLDDDGMDSLPLGQRVKTRLERDLAEALGTPVIDEPMSFSSSPFIAQPAQPPLSPPQPRATATAVPLVPSIRRPSITGLGIHAPVVRSNSNGYTGSDDGEEEVFHQAIDHFIHPLSTSPHQRVSPQTTSTAIAPGASPTPTPALTNAIKSPSTTTPSPSNYSSPPSSPAPAPLAVLANPTRDDVATPLLPPASGDDEKEKKEEEEEEQGAESPKTRPFYGVGIHGRVSVDEYAQEVGESIQKKVPPMDLGRGLALPSVDDDDDERKEEEKLEEVALERPVVNVVAPTGDEYSYDTDRPVVEVDDVEDVEAVNSPHTTITATAEKEEPTSTERRLSTLRYGGVGLHALTPSDEYVQDIEEAMQRPPPVDLSRPYFDSEDEKEEEDGDDRGETKNPPEEQKVDKVRDEDEVQTDDEATEATTTVSSAIDRIEDDSLAAAEVKNHIATALRYGAVGLHGKTPFDEYAQEIEESIQRGAQAREGEYLEGVERRSESSDDDEEDRVAAHVGDKKDATNKPLPPSISTRPLSSVYARGPPTDSSFDYSSSSDNLDSYDSSNPSSPSSPFPSSPSTTGTTPQTAVQKELRDLRRASQRRRKIQLVDDAQRKKEQLARIREQLERKALGKIREQVSFWETKGVLEQKVVGAEEVVVEDDGDDGGEGGAITSESENKEPSPGGLLSLSQEHLRGGRSGNKKSSGEPMSPGNSQSPGGYYSEMPQLAPRRSLSTTSSTNDKIHSQVGSRPSSTPKPSEIDVFLSNVD
ncbi:hypothetical protein BGZ88_002836 [Linnemannia elongata]|nr:hypothetical protein BGZ88_002836 [Linnemannia elongata]